MKKYDPIVSASDPAITIRIPKNILRDLVSRSIENGQTVENELAKRLLRTLERDLEMIEEDNILAASAFDKVQKNPMLAIAIFAEQQ